MHSANSEWPACANPQINFCSRGVVASWASYLRETALDKKRERKQLGVGEREILNEAIQFATNYKNEGKRFFALKSITEAEAVDPGSLPMLLKKAEILGARANLPKHLTRSINTICAPSMKNGRRPAICAMNCYSSRRARLKT